MKLTAPQIRALEAIRDGKVSNARDMGWFQKGGYWTPRGVRVDVVARVIEAGLAESPPFDLGGAPSVTVQLTDAGVAALERNEPRDV